MPSPSAFFKPFSRDLSRDRLRARERSRETQAKANPTLNLTNGSSFWSVARSQVNVSVVRRIG
jgi:hypothetical protein